MRWTEQIALVAKDYAPDDEGVLTPTVTETVVFCNEYTVGAETWQFYHEAGVSEVAEVQVHSNEYDGQRDVIYQGKRYSVVEIKREGDFTRLVLRQQMSDPEAEDGESGGQ